LHRFRKRAQEDNQPVAIPPVVGTTPPGFFRAQEHHQMVQRSSGRRNCRQAGDAALPRQSRSTAAPAGGVVLIELPFPQMVRHRSGGSNASFLQHPRSQIVMVSSVGYQEK